MCHADLSFKQADWFQPMFRGQIQKWKKNKRNIILIIPEYTTVKQVLTNNVCLLVIVNSLVQNNCVENI